MELGVTNGAPTDQVITLLTAAGETIATYTGADQGVWLDDRSFVLYRFERRPVPESEGVWELARDQSRNPIATTALASVDGTTLSDIGVPPGIPLPNGRDAIAVGWFDSNGQTATAKFTVWSTRGTTETRDGMPISWSPDGDRLALLQVSDSGPGVEGWPEVVTWPGLNPVFTDKSARISDEVELWLPFDAAGQQLAYFDGPVMKVADLTAATGMAWDEGGPYGSVVWDAAGRLVIADFVHERVAAYEPDGSEVEAWSNVARVVIGTTDGRTIAFYRDRSFPPPVITVVQEGAARDILLPDRLATSKPDISADGRALLVVCLIREHPTVLLHRL